MVRFEKGENSSAYYACLGDDADRDFARDVLQNDKCMRVIFVNDVAVGLLVAGEGKTIWMHIYIFPEHRGQGYGSEAYEAFLKAFVTDETEEIMTWYNEEDKQSFQFASRRGFSHKFSSDYMSFEGDTYPQDAPVRPYHSEDFDEVFAFYAEAFHRMRLSTGCFPESQPQQPSQAIRNHWDEKADEYFVYELEGKPVALAHLLGNEISSLSVHPSYQGKGIGRNFLMWIMNHILDEYGKVDLYCVIGNHKARKLYDSLGFKTSMRICYSRKTTGRKVDGQLD